MTAWAVLFSVLATIPGGFTSLSSPTVSIASFPQGTDLSLDLRANGELLSDARATIANGSLLRFAIDGNFSPLLGALPLNDSTRNSIAQAIYSAEGGQFATFFGNHDGRVEPGEVDSFQSLLIADSGVFPTWLILAGSAPSVTIDGQAAAAMQLVAVQITGGVGLDTSPAPVSIFAQRSDQYVYGSGGHLLTISWNLFSASTVLGAPRPLNVSLRLPDATQVESTSGFLSASTAQDPWGLAAASLSGSAQPSSAAPLTVRFSPAFPWAMVVIIVGVAGVAASLAVIWRVRRRSRRGRSTRNEVGPS